MDRSVTIQIDLKAAVVAIGAILALGLGAWTFPPASLPNPEQQTACWGELQVLPASRSPRADVHTYHIFNRCTDQAFYTSVEFGERHYVWHATKSVK